MKRIAIGLAGLVLALGFLGCGGSGSGTTSSLLQFQIAWAARSARAVDAPSSALSFELTLFQEHQGTPPSYTVRGQRNRDRLEAHIQTFKSTMVVPPGQYIANFTFYANEDYTGAAVGYAGAMVDIKSDGTGIGTIATNGMITQMVVPPGQNLGVAERKNLVYEARDSTGAMVAISPGSCFFTSSNAGVLRLEGYEMIGVAAGTARVTVTTDNVTGEADVTVNAPAPPVVFEVPDPVVVPGGRVQLRATLTGHSDQTQAWSLAGAGPWHGTITESGLYTADAAAMENSYDDVEVRFTGITPNVTARVVVKVVPVARVRTLWSNGNAGWVDNGGTSPSFTTTEPKKLYSIYTYHWNYSNGVLPGTIALQRTDGFTLGPWATVGLPGQGGAPSVYWFAALGGLLLPPGTYTIIDSDPSTWAQNSGTGGLGMSWIEEIVD